MKTNLKMNKYAPL